MSSSNETYQPFEEYGDRSDELLKQRRTEIFSRLAGMVVGNEEARARLEHELSYIGLELRERAVVEKPVHDRLEGQTAADMSEFEHEFTARTT